MGLFKKKRRVSKTIEIDTLTPWLNGEKKDLSFEDTTKIEELFEDDD